MRARVPLGAWAWARAVAAAAAVAVVAGGGGGGARAHGTLPSANSLSFARDGRVLLGTNFGAIVVDVVDPGDPGDPGDAERFDFLCELLATGAQQTVDAWLWLDDGAVAGVVTQGGFTRGVFASDASACTFMTAPGSEGFLMGGLAADPAGGGRFFASGGDDARAVVLAGDARGTSVVYEVAGATAHEVVASGARVAALFSAGATWTLALRDGEGAGGGAFVARELTLPEGETLRLVGIDGATVWLVQRGEASDVLVRSDGGAALEVVHTFAARINGFAARGGEVYVQAGSDGVMRVRPGGGGAEGGAAAVEVLAGSPHGSCLAFDGDGALVACGVPWQDDVALARWDGAAWRTLMRRFDDIGAARACDGVAGAATTCADELQFLRGYYGFEGGSGAEADDGPEVVEDAEGEGAEAGPDASEGAEGEDGEDGVEAGPDASDDDARAEDAGAEVEAARPRDEGCAGGAGAAGASLAAALVAAVAGGRLNGRRKIAPAIGDVSVVRVGAPQLSSGSKSPSKLLRSGARPAGGRLKACRLIAPGP